jgi:hypothetical protein
MSDHSTPTDGNPPAPIRRYVPPRIGDGWSLEKPSILGLQPRLTVAGPCAVKHGNFDVANEARRTVHGGATSHDTEDAA